MDVMKILKYMCTDFVSVFRAHKFTEIIIPAIFAMTAATVIVLTTDIVGMLTADIVLYGYWFYISYRAVEQQKQKYKYHGGKTEYFQNIR